MASMLIGACSSPFLLQIPSSSSLPLSHGNTISPFPSAAAALHNAKRLSISRVGDRRFITNVDKAEKEPFLIRAFAEDEGKAATAPVSKKKSKLLVKPHRSPRLVLRFLWLEKNIGIGLDQVVPGHGTVPLSPFYFWPRKDAWEELKTKLESKPWISRKRTIILLNQATDVINLWQQSATIY
ncbi:hypothetical protein O6H91_Y173400 [Diphasiastrum complanatum]|nr:hypothetical protein O6H91_Y267500 [Diphasiastrum complanatum]KAJ7295641.1 hypothetical protein O6H91_Y173400 [Diphasiastrum complanatum]